MAQRILERGRNKAGEPYLTVETDEGVKTINDPEHIRFLEAALYSPQPSNMASTREQRAMAEEELPWYSEEPVYVDMQRPEPPPRALPEDAPLGERVAQFRERFPVQATPRRGNEVVGAPLDTPTVGGRKAVYATPGGSMGMDLGARQPGDYPIPASWSLTEEEKAAAGYQTLTPVGVPRELLSKDEEKSLIMQLRKERGNEETNRLIRRMQSDLDLTDEEIEHLY